MASRATGVVTVPEAVTVVPAGDVPLAVATFVYEPLRSLAVTACVAVQEMVAPAASEATGTAGEHDDTAAFGSVTPTLVSVAVPVLVTAIV